MTTSEWRQAVPSLEKSLSWLPTNATTYYFLGICCQKQACWHDAVKYLQRSILLDPDFKLSLIAVSNCHLKLGRFQEAVDTCMVGLNRHPDSMLMKFNVGQATYFMIQKGIMQSEDNLALQARAREFLDCARRHVPDQWNEGDQRMLDYLYAAPEDRNTFVRRADVHIWKVFGW